jgi:hypothetical protein
MMPLAHSEANMARRYDETPKARTIIPVSLSPNLVDLPTALDIYRELLKAMRIQEETERQAKRLEQQLSGARILILPTLQRS